MSLFGSAAGEIYTKERAILGYQSMRTRKRIKDASAVPITAQASVNFNGDASEFLGSRSS